MANFDAIPSEILAIIFQSIDSARQLGQCRRVCKKWNDPAEYAMFCKPVFVTAYNATSLLTHLTKKPSRAKLIKILYLNVYTFTEPASQLLRLALTPCIERIVAPEENTTDRMLTLIHDIARESQVGFPNLKSIPAPDEFSDIYRETLLLFKDSLETICIPIDEENEHFAFDELTDFKQLSKLSISCYFQDLPHIESLLNRARHLKEIEFGYCGFRLSRMHQVTSDWMKQQVEINQQAIIIKLSKETYRDPSVSQYLAYKYPNMKHLQMESRPYPNQQPENNQHFYRALSQIPSFTMRDRHSFESLIPYFKILKGNKNVVRLLYMGTSRKPSFDDDDDSDDDLDYSEYDDYEKNKISRYSTFQSRVNQQQQRTTEVQINVYRPTRYNYNLNYVRLLEEINSFVTDLQVDLVQAYLDDDFADEDWDTSPNLETEVFLKVLNHAQGLEKLEFRAHSICEIDKAALRPRQRRQLDRLKIVSANLDKEIFPYLSGTFHTINNLTLFNCSLGIDHETGITSILLTSTKVGSLLINTEKNAQPGYSRFLDPDDPYGVGGEFPDLLRKYKNRMKKNKPREEVHVMLSLQGNTTALFKVQPNCSDILPLTMEEYTSRPRILATYHISCQSLAHLELNVNDMHAKIDISKYFESLTQ